jgi:Integrase core domain/Chromo (CHRromatin Organisation MOdifier) domain
MRRTRKVAPHIEKHAIVHELHAPARRRYPRRITYIHGLNDLWQADLMDMTTYAKDNNGHSFILVVMDCFSKTCYATPVKQKTASNMKIALNDAIQNLNNGISPKHLQTDDGKEFFNKSVKSLLLKYKVIHYSTKSITKAAMVERLIRTLKSSIWRYFSLRGNHKWLDILPDVVSKYNNTIHSVIKMRPNDVTKHNEKKLLDVYNRMAIRHLHSKKSNMKFKKGDNVRISKYKTVFEKGYTPNWTTEIFTILSAHRTTPPTYKLKDFEGHPIEGTFYNEELQKVKYPNAYLVEKILRKKGKKVLVKWYGFPHSKNTWENATNILK